MQAAIATLGSAGKVADMDLDEVETAEKKTKKKDKKKRTAAEVQADIGDRLAATIPAAACILTSNHDGLASIMSLGCAQSLCSTSS